jgi:3-phosphoshikimate 1-carboxyvinyltransferase
MTERHYPDKLEIVPLKKPPHATVRVPGSKSITNRALVLAALSEPGEGSELHNVADCEDSHIMVDALRELGFRINEDWQNLTLQVRRHKETNRIPARAATLLLANSGTSMRFLTAMVCLGEGKYELDGISRMRDRPIGDLLIALRELGVRARCLGNDGYPPIQIQPGGSVFTSRNWTSGSVNLKGDVSSQFLSALLMVAPFATSPFRIQLTTPLVSRPYVHMTIEMMRLFGAQTKTDDDAVFEVWPISWYESRTFEVESDASAASYIFAAAAICEAQAEVPGLPANSLQGDLDFLKVLDEMGCKVAGRQPGRTWKPGTPAWVQGFSLHGVDVDMNDMSDCVPTLAAVACFAEGPTTIRNVAHIRHKESDRITAMATELRKVGAEVDEFPDGLRITPRPLHGAEIETYNDHRIAMSMALIGLKVPGIVIKNPGCVAKTYPGFWDDLEKLRKE